ncbi:MAG: RHS repeat-associated core domain-containing protein, partial [Treponema sp.]|nr:RHS repeat-associated core domain-containing protein [Treponema sp.]
FSGMYAGKEIDTETGLTYHWNRWRNEEGDAFISEDPIRDGYNWYGYALGNPFKYADGTGLETHVCRDGTFCNEGDISNPSYRADCYHYNGYNAGTIASMSGPAYNLANNTVPGTEGPGGATASPTAAEEIKNCGNVDIEKITLGKISDTVELLEKMQEVNERITELVEYMSVICDDGRIHEAALYGQHAWTKELGFEKNFNITACCATDLLDITSIFYTIETGKTLSFEQAVKTMMSAVGKLNGIDREDAYVKNMQTTIDYMTEYLGLSTKFTYNEGKGEIFLLPLAAKNYEIKAGVKQFAGYDTGYPGHFILCLDSILGLPKNTYYCYEPDSNKYTRWASDGRCGIIPGAEYIFLNGMPICRPLQEGRGVRAFDITR